jgi:RNA polymerase sigma factor (TIGR02999 family)
MPSSSSSPASVTGLLHAWRGGDASALERLMPLVYEELRRIARRHLRGENPGQTMGATDIVHEAFLRLVDTEVSWQNRAHFLAVCARMMRRILVDRARARARTKRGSGQRPLSLDVLEGRQASGLEPSLDLLALDQALQQLTRLDPRRAGVVELFFFGGLTYDEIAEVVGESRSTVHRDLRLAKAWLQDFLSNDEGTVDR